MAGSSVVLFVQRDGRMVPEPPECLVRHAPGIERRLLPCSLINPRHQSSLITGDVFVVTNRIVWNQTINRNRAVPTGASRWKPRGGSS